MANAINFIVVTAAKYDDGKGGSDKEAATKDTQESHDKRHPRVRIFLQVIAAATVHPSARPVGGRTATSRLGAWASYASDSLLTWTARSAAVGWVLETAELR